jgi:uncharacterized membrane protein YbaN (DUF454 family)
MRKDELNISKSRALRAVLIAAGWLNVVLGVIGIFLPVMPTTVFFLIAAACFAKSSEKFYWWLLNNKQFGKLIKDFREKRGMSLKSKLTAVTVLLVVISYSAIFAVDSVIISILLAIIGISVSIYLISLNTIRD